VKLLLDAWGPIFEKSYDEFTIVKSSKHSYDDFTIVNMLIFESSYDDFIILSYDKV